MEISRADTEGGEESVGFWREGMQPRAFPIEVASWPFDLHHGGEIKPSRCSASSKVKLEVPNQTVERVILIRREQPNPDDRGIAGNHRRRGRFSTIRRLFWRNRSGYREGKGFVSLSGRYLSCPLVLLMARKRKSEAMGLDEADRTLYSTFCAAANSLSQVYTQAMNQQKISFQAGERHALNEMDYAGEGSLVSPRSPFQHQHHQTTIHLTNTGIQPASGLFGQPTVGLASRSGHSDQAKNSVFSNALSSPVCRSLQPYHLAQGSGLYANTVIPTGTAGARNHDPNQNRDTNSLSSNDSSMDIHTDSPPHEAY
ncbi:uncharacterized protein LOC103985764 isoform X2 [Musa acuminata AAA Group]|uniref:uncharacterized protein LOC103985764 isoform X2 n=1 Tax=Musa acuminata AAA Group TaxID=214697 RepID=UPI0031D09858